MMRRNRDEGRHRDEPDVPLHRADSDSVDLELVNRVQRARTSERMHASTKEFAMACPTCRSSEDNKIQRSSRVEEENEEINNAQLEKEEETSLMFRKNECGNGPNGGGSCFSLFGDSSPYTLEELRAIERNRRAILKRVELPFWQILFSWDGTCLKVLIKDALLWGTMAIYVLVRWQAYTGNLPHYVKDLENTNIDVIGGFLSFFLVLFVNQNNSRFLASYGKAMDCTERIQDVASIAAVYLPKAQAHRMVRYMNGAHAAAYVGLASKTYTMKNCFSTLNHEYRFLTQREMDRIREIGMETGPDAYREILLWVIKDIKKVQDAAIIDARMSGELRDKVQNFREAMSCLFSDKEHPTHFFYIHFLCLLTVFYLPLFAVSTAYTSGVKVDNGGNGDQVEIHWTTEILCGVIVFLQAVFVIGLRLLGKVMVDPFGDDEEDLSVIHYVEDTWQASNRILNAHFPHEDVDPEEEAEIARTRSFLGTAWETVDRQHSLVTAESSKPHHPLV